jgi:hypothetical protein
MDRKCETYIDPERGHIIKQMFEKVAYEKCSGKKIYNWLKFELNFRSAYGKKHLSLGNIFRSLSNPFYYGEFEYPRKSGNWYKGKHTAIVTKDLYNSVKNQLSEDYVVRTQSKEFAFTKMINCGLCGSGITADEKFKKLKDGTMNRYVYYGCTKFNDKNCKCGYIREEDLVDQLANILDVVSLNEIGMKDRIKEEIQSHNEFQESVLERDSLKKIKVKEIDIRNYAKYILRRKSIREKRELLNNLKSKLVLNDKEIYIED